MTGYDLMCDWPALKALSPQEILAFPAWYDTLEYEGEPQRITAVPSPAGEPLPIAVTVDGNPQTVLLWDSDCYPDLHRLWSRLADLPREVTLALVEKECDNALHLLESLAHGHMQVVGIGEAVPEAAWTCFRLVASDGELLVGLVPSPAAIAEMGTVGHLDSDHESVRSLVRTAHHVYAKLDLDDVGIASLRAGDCLAASEQFPKDGAWLYDLPDDGHLRIVEESAQEISFGAYLDGDLPLVPEKPSLVLFRGSAPCAACFLRALGDVRVACLNTNLQFEKE